MDLSSLKDAMARGAIVIDTRSSAEYSEGHLPGALSIPVGPAFAARLVLVAPSGAGVVLLAADEAALGIARDGVKTSGITQVGWGDASLLAAWREDGGALGTLAQVPSRSAVRSSRLIIDVREQTEWDAGHAVGARHAPLEGLLERLADVPRDQPIVMYCQAGTRGTIAASVLRANGFTDVANLEGGLDAWCGAGLPVEHGREPEGGRSP
jgi:hydroxyacylglutathione hydrolase